MAYKRWRPFLQYINEARVVRDRNTFCIIAEFTQGGSNIIARFPFAENNKEEEKTAFKIAQAYADKIHELARYIEEAVDNA